MQNHSPLNTHLQIPCDHKLPNKIVPHPLPPMIGAPFLPPTFRRAFEKNSPPPRRPLIPWTCVSAHLQHTDLYLSNLIALTWTSRNASSSREYSSAPLPSPRAATTVMHIEKPTVDVEDFFG
ncbi:hypothetical protein HBI38_083430 [Parastagonospora nodorum]|nr:hypothetical protein HBI10_079520 [Parastagonospora nodorum]KAH4031997.1 hypothetical protein HBI13_018680 [Parastagonospora nodorum]KAH4049668.1 hypothetical protein HBH49_135950 [Parastagonospora nodorum]KAH4108303.1 hypothetical protein HBH46_042550 [Parastagonospora nodorum]KAH4126279.1 hypothetical protein HBH47_057770 [Parastagonospora nodorum]